jgi:hypothetical protein
MTFKKRELQFCKIENFLVHTNLIQKLKKNPPENMKGAKIRKLLTILKFCKWKKETEWPFDTTFNFFFFVIATSKV